MKSNFLLATTLAFCTMAGSVAAAPVPMGPSWAAPRSAPQQQAQANPAAILREGMTRLVAFLQKNPNPAQISAFVDNQIAPYFDFSYMTQWVAGRNYRYMNQGQRRAMENKLKQMFLGALAQRLGGYANQGVRFNRPRRVTANEVSVGVTILQPGSYPARLNFRFYKSDDGWKVFDVSANGSSALVHYRQVFARLRYQQPRRWTRG
jgi:phospholipid transport system substrate-binding protein